jgi:hypothetical protein
LDLQDDGNLVLYDCNRKATWATGTDGGKPKIKLGKILVFAGIGLLFGAATVATIVVVIKINEKDLP